MRRNAAVGTERRERGPRTGYSKPVGVIIDITDKLTLLRRARRLAKDVQRTQLRMAVRFVRATEQEVRRQMLVLCDKDAEAGRVEEAIAIMPLLVDLLRQRRDHLEALEREFLGAPVALSIDD